MDVIEEPKYLKRKKKSGLKRCDHKHIYRKCLLNSKDRNCITGSYCIICGKTKGIKLFETESVEGTNYSRMLSSEEVREKYKGLEQFEVNNCMDKYVVLVNKEEI